MTDAAIIVIGDMIGGDIIVTTGIMDGIGDIPDGIIIATGATITVIVITECIGPDIVS